MGVSEDIVRERRQISGSGALSVAVASSDRTVATGATTAASGNDSSNDK